MAFTNNTYGASMQDVFALRLEMMNQVKALQEAIAEGGGGVEYLDCEVTIEADESWSTYTIQKTAAELKAAIAAGKIIRLNYTKMEGEHESRWNSVILGVGNYDYDYHLPAAITLLDASMGAWYHASTDSDNPYIER